MNIISVQPIEFNDKGNNKYILPFVISKNSLSKKEERTLKEFIQKETKEVFGNDILFSEYSANEIVTELQEDNENKTTNQISKNPAFRNYVRSSLNKFTFVYDKRALDRTEKNLQEVVEFANLGFYTTMNQRNYKNKISFR